MGPLAPAGLRRPRRRGRRSARRSAPTCPHAAPRRWSPRARWARRPGAASTTTSRRAPADVATRRRTPRAAGCAACAFPGSLSTNVERVALALGAQGPGGRVGRRRPGRPLARVARAERPGPRPGRSSSTTARSSPTRTAILRRLEADRARAAAVARRPPRRARAGRRLRSTWFNRGLEGRRRTALAAGPGSARARATPSAAARVDRTASRRCSADGDRTCSATRVDASPTCCARPVPALRRPCRRRPDDRDPLPRASSAEHLADRGPAPPTRA